MQITHNEVTAGLWLVVSASSYVAGRIHQYWRSDRLLDGEYDRGHDDGRDVGYQDGRFDAFDEIAEDVPRPGPTVDGSVAGTGPGYPPSYGSRRTMLLEPGPTIYPALAALAQEALDGPESHAEPSDSTWLMRMRLWMESEYPISQDSPSGRMAEAI